MDKKRPKLMTPKARSKRAKRSLRSKAAAPPQKSERIIVSTSAIEDLVNLCLCHFDDCEGATFRIHLSSTHPSIITVKCQSCGETISVEKDRNDVHHLPLNEAIAAGALCSGSGYSSLKTLFSSMEVRMMAKATYYAAEDRVAAKLKDAVTAEFKRAGEQEKELAEEAGDMITLEGVDYPHVRVVGDGGWGKRSYGHGGNSNSGVAVIIGERTKKLLFMGTRIKRCGICDKRKQNSTESLPEGEGPDEVGKEASEETSQVIPDHDCHKNWTGTSQAMEADIILEGFKASLVSHGLLYRYLIADADSSVFAKIQTSLVYPGKMLVEKIDCLNHGVRCLNSTVYGIIKNTAYPKSHRDAIEKETTRYGKDVKAAVKYNHDHQEDSNNRTSAMSLSADLMNIPFHIHGSHKHCKEYFCKDKEKNSDKFQLICNSPAFSELKAAFHRLANRSHRLIFNVTSNFAESFMSVMAKTTSGKRIDYPVDGYNRRANSAALSFNCGAFWLPKVYPSTSINDIWEKAVDYFDYENRGPNKGRKNRSSNRSASSDDPSYGTNADPGENTPKELKENVGKLFQSLQVPSIIERDRLERATIGQVMNPLWMHEKRYRSTASTSGRIFTFADHLDNSSLLKSTCYPRDLSFIKNILNGINQEPEAKRLYSELNGVEVQESGLFVYRRNGILAASPDGLLPDNGIIEVKCVNCPPSEIPKRADNFLIHTTKGDPSSPLTIRKSHKYFRQMVMQLIVSEMDYCDLFVYHKPKDTTANPLCFQERIFKDKESRALWGEMEPKLVHFWLEDQAPEHANPRYPYTKSFRTPQYRAEAIALRQEQKEEAQKKKNTPRMSKEDVLRSIDTVIGKVIAM